MNSSIFLVSTDNRLTELHRTDYASEDLFQQLLADHPAMLTIAAGSGRKNHLGKVGRRLVPALALVRRLTLALGGLQHVNQLVVPVHSQVRWGERLSTVKGPATRTLELSTYGLS